MKTLIPHLNEQPNEYKPPVGIAGIACLVCLAFMLTVTRQARVLLDAWWAELLAYGMLPVLVGFAILYRSRWHREMGRLSRVFFMILTSCFLFFCVLLFAGMVAVGLYIAFYRLTAFKD